MSLRDTLPADNSDQVVKMLFEVNKEDRRRLKVAAFYSDMSMKDFMIAAINEKIINDGLEV